MELPIKREYERESTESGVEEVASKKVKTEEAETEAEAKAEAGSHDEIMSDSVAKQEEEEEVWSDDEFLFMSYNCAEQKEEEDQVRPTHAHLSSFGVVGVGGVGPWGRIRFKICFVTSVSPSPPIFLSLAPLQKERRRSPLLLFNPYPTPTSIPKSARTLSCIASPRDDLRSLRRHLYLFLRARCCRNPNWSISQSE